MRLRLSLALAALTLAQCRCTEQDLDEEKPSLRTPLSDVELGPVPEGSTVDGVLHLANKAGGKLEIHASLADGASTDFTLPVNALVLESLQEADLVIHYVPTGSGEDRATLVLTTSDEEHAREQVSIHGGPIAPNLTATPNPLAFPSATAFTETGVITLRNEGNAFVTIRSVGVGAGGNPDFSTQPLPGEVTLHPGDAQRVTVTYARSTRSTSGHLIVLSTDPAHGMLDIPLLATPVGLCGDDVDNDEDGLTDYPDDPGCNDVNDPDEADPSACLDGATIRCGTDEGACHAGTRSCSAGHFGACNGVTGPATEACNGLDDDCDGQTDEFLECTPSASSSSATSGPAPSSSSRGSSSSSRTSSSGPAPECTQASECGLTVDNSAGCHLFECTDGTCSDTLRHDGPSWRVTPNLSAEVRIGDNGQPRKVLFDGENFMVVMQLMASGIVGRRVSPSAGIVDAQPFLMDPRYTDIAWGQDRYLELSLQTNTVDPLNDMVMMQTRSANGAATGQKVVLFNDNGGDCGGSPPHLANGLVVSNGNRFFVTAVSVCQSKFVYAAIDGSGALPATVGTGYLGNATYRPRVPRPSSWPGGFAIFYLDNVGGGGGNDGWVTLFSLNAVGMQGGMLYPRPMDGSSCCMNSHTLLWGNTQFLAAYSRDFTNVEVLGTDLVPGPGRTPPVPPVQLHGPFYTFERIPLGFDGTNFLALSEDASTAITAVRITESGTLLDTPAFEVSPPDAAGESNAHLGSDGRGRYLAAYTKADGHVYVRLFSTCP